MLEEACVNLVLVFLLKNTKICGDFCLVNLYEKN